jgi:hypothetical protein
MGWLTYPDERGLFFGLSLPDGASAAWWLLSFFVSRFAEALFAMSFLLVPA